MNITDIDVNHFFSTAPNFGVAILGEKTEQLAIDLNNGIYTKVLTRFPEADHYAVYLEAASLLFAKVHNNNKYITADNYPEYFI